MVAVVKSGYSIYRMVNYNEQKVFTGAAVCIGAGNYPLDPQNMSMSMRLGYLKKQIDLNQRAQRTSIHISLNFSPKDSDLSEQKLLDIAETYMQGIGFGTQPYLVYQHNDAGHPHIHIVTTSIKRDGKTIDTYMIGRLKSEPARKSIEKEFGLIRAEEQGKSEQYRPEPIAVSRLDYGRLETKKAIQNILEHILPAYKFASLAELNAVLGRYNVTAQQGEQGSRIQKHNGLLYRMLDADGNPVGIPIKASSFYSKPTLERLSVYFHKNAEKPAPQKSRVRNAIDLALNRPGATLEGLTEQIKIKGIDLVMRRNENGFIYGLTYIDHVSKCVFNGSDLGKSYSAKAVQERCLVSQLQDKGVDIKQIEQLSTRADTSKANTSTSAPEPDWTATASTNSPSFISQLFDCLLQTEQTTDYIPYELSQNSNRKKRKKRSVKR